MSREPDFFDSKSVDLIFYPNETITIVGIRKLLLFFKSELKKWTNLDSSGNKYKSAAIIYYERTILLLDDLINNKVSTDKGDTTNYWNQIYSNNIRRDFEFPIFSSTYHVEYIKILTSHGSSYADAYHDLRYEYARRGRNETVKEVVRHMHLSRESKERSKPISSLIATYSKHNDHIRDVLAESELLLKDFQSKTSELLEVEQKAIDEKKDHFDSLARDGQLKYTERMAALETDYAAQHERLKTLYQTELRLKAPADHWAKRADDLGTSMNRYIALLVLVAIVLSGLLYVAITLINADQFANMSTFASFKWSFFAVTALTLLAYLVRVFSRLVLSHYHLKQDALERLYLTHYYLSLLNENEAAVKDDERHLIIQSLFSRSDSGMLKDDGGHTMPIPRPIS